MDKVGKRIEKTKAEYHPFGIKMHKRVCVI